MSAMQVNQEAVQVVLQGMGKGGLSMMLGAYASLQAVFEDPDCPLLIRQSLTGSITWQTRNENTISRVVQSPNRAPLFIAALTALGARAIFSTEEGSLADTLSRTLFHDDPLLAIRVPVTVPGRNSAMSTVSMTPADVPIVAAMAVVDFSDNVVSNANLVLTGVWREHSRLAEAGHLLEGKELTDANIQTVADAVQQEIEPRNDYRASTEYRRAMATVLSRRALAECRKGTSAP